MKNGPEAHVEAVRCILTASRETKTEIPVYTFGFIQRVVGSNKEADMARYVLVEWLHRW